MSSFAIKSRPVYPQIEWDRTGRQHILLAASEGNAGPPQVSFTPSGGGNGAAVSRGHSEDAVVAERLLGNLPAGPVTLIHLRPGAPEGANPWAKARPGQVTRRVVATLPEALDALREALQAARMGARLYLVGPEDAIWQASHIAAGFGMGRGEIRRMQAGTQARPVFCVHCRAITRDVRTNVVPCSGCGRPLFVRDHFSSHLGAYMGFQVDAEVPGDVPSMEEIYP